MQRFEKRTITMEKETLVEVKCDLCGRQGYKGEICRWGDGSAFCVAEVEVTMREGAAYPEDVSYTRIECDICCYCFKSKLKPWLESQGVTFREREVD